MPAHLAREQSLRPEADEDDDGEQTSALATVSFCRKAMHAGELAEDEGAGNGADKALHAAEHDDHEGVDHIARSHLGRHALKRRDEGAGKPRKARPIGEGQAIDALALMPKRGRR